MKFLFSICVLCLFFAGNAISQDSVFIRSYGLTGYNYGEKIIQDADTGFLILGNKSGFVGNTDVYLVKTNKYGNLVWDKAFGSDEINWADDFVFTTDSKYAIAGYMSITANNNDYNLMLIKADADGNMLWMKNYGGNNWDIAHSILETPDGGFIIVGETYSFGNGNSDVFLLKTDKDGDSLWSKTYGGINNDAAYDISFCHDGNYIITGMTNSFGNGGYDAYLLKINPSGDTLWTKTFGDTLDDKAYAGIETKDHGIIFAGSTRNYNVQNQDGIILKTDSIGNYLWKQLINGEENEDLSDIVQDKNENFFFVGYTESYGYVGTQDFSISFRDKNGNFITGITYGGEKQDYANACINTNTGGYAIVGTTESMGPGISNILVIKMDSLLHTNSTNYIHVLDISEQEKNDIIIYPNPVSEYLFINISETNTLKNISIYNITGNIIFQKEIDNYNNLSIGFKEIPEGVYIIRLQYKDRIITQKIIHTK